MLRTHARNLYIGTTVERTALAASLPTDGIGATFYDTDLDTVYVWNGTIWKSLGGSGSVDAFIDLADVPAAYTDQGGKLVKVNVGETGLEFVAPSAGDGDVVGPEGAVGDNLPLFDGLTGKLIKDSGVALADLEPVRGDDDNYVTDAEKTVIGNTSGTNTGDQQGDGVTVTGAGTLADPFVAVGDGKVTPAYGVADVFGFGNAGSSGWTGTINGAPSGAVITYTHVSGNKTSLKPLATLLARQRLHNITRGEYGLILTSNDTSTITLTENVPVTWQSGDTITTNSPTVNLAGYVDIEFIDGVGVGVNGLFLLLNLKDTAAVGATVVIHPYAAYNTRKAIVLYTQVVNIFFNAVAPVAIISDCFVLKWGAGGVNTETVTVRFVAEF